MLSSAYQDRVTVDPGNQFTWSEFQEEVGATKQLQIGGMRGEVSSSGWI